MGTLTLICAGCSDVFTGKSGEIWCPKCLPTVKPFTFDLSAEQRKIVESVAVVRGITPAEVVRQGIVALSGKPKGRRPRPEDYV